MTLGWLLIGATAVAVTLLIGVSVGSVSISPVRVAAELLDHIPGVHIISGLSAPEKAIVWQIRTPRVVLGLLVGAMLAASGAAYQGVFRNPLADPYLLGIGAGAGLGATVAVVLKNNPVGQAGNFVALSAFAGALLAVIMTTTIGTGANPFSSRKRVRNTSVTNMLLAGVAVTSFLTALQTFIQQRNTDLLRQIYSWILGRLQTTGWHEVLLLLPYSVVCFATLIYFAPALNVLSVGEDEAATLGINPGRTRTIVLLAASLSAAAAVSVSGLIGFVGLVIPHAIRMVAGSSYRRIIPLSILMGGSFLAVADIGARTLQAPAEIPIGVITAFVGAPFFLFVMRATNRART